MDTSYQNWDFRGIFAYGDNCATLYVVWHGSCQEYDWHCNIDQYFIQPNP